MFFVLHREVGRCEKKLEVGWLTATGNWGSLAHGELHLWALVQYFEAGQNSWKDVRVLWVYVWTKGSTDFSFSASLFVVFESFRKYPWSRDFVRVMASSTSTDG